MKVLLLVDVETVPPDDPLFEGSVLTPESEMEYHVAKGLRATGHTVDVLPFGPDIARNVQELARRAPDVVFNLTEWFKGNRRLDASIAGLLDLAGVPYTGAGPIGLMLCRDKELCKRILGHHRIRLPHFVTVPLGQQKLGARMVYPAIVKPLFEDGSDGISLASIVQDEAALRERVRMIHEQRRQPAICEAYIEGREIYVACIGNDRLRVFPPREIVFGKAEEGGPNIATARVKWDDAYRTKWRIEYCHAECEPALERRLVRVSKSIFRTMHLRDYGRMDFRVTPDNAIYFLEANPNPNLAPDDELAEAAQKAGVAYPDLLDQIIKHAARRYT